MNRRVLFALLVTLPWAGALARAGEHYEVVVEREVPVKMRDGVVLRADIYRPKAEGKFPVLLCRTPYDKHSEIDFAPLAAARGYVVVAQDVRGRFGSEGEWYTFKYESQDGYDTVEWAAALPYSNGKVGMYSGSYVGPPRCLRPSPLRRIWQRFVPRSLPRTITRVGPIKEARSRSGSANPGRAGWP